MFQTICICFPEVKLGIMEYVLHYSIIYASSFISFASATRHKLRCTSQAVLFDQKIRELTQNDIHAIDKMDFLSILTKIHSHAFSSINILSGITIASLIPLK